MIFNQLKSSTKLPQPLIFQIAIAFIRMRPSIPSLLSLLRSAEETLSDAPLGFESGFNNEQHLAHELRIAPTRTCWIDCTSVAKPNCVAAQLTDGRD